MLEVVKQIIEVKFDDIYNSKTFLSNLYRDTPLTRRWAFDFESTSTSYKPQISAWYAHFKYLKKIHDSIDGLLSNNLEKILLDRYNNKFFEGENMWFLYEIKENGKNIFKEGPTYNVLHNTKKDFWFYYKQVALSGKVESVSYWEKFMDAHGFKVSLSGLEELLKSKWFNTDYIEQKLIEYIKVFSWEQINFIPSLLLNKFDLTQPYTISFGTDFHTKTIINWSENVQLDIKKLFMIKNDIEETVKIWERYFNRLKDYFKKLKEDWYESHFGLIDFEVIKKDRRVLEVFENNQGKKVFLIDFLFDNFSLNFSDLKEFVNHSWFYASTDANDKYTKIELKRV